jgi:ABC-type nitrate/sulfonate/bicarbonate transport system substrate-binding protein
MSMREKGKQAMAGVRFGIGSSNYFNMPFWVAQRTGLFDQYGVSPEPDVYNSIEEADEGLRSERFPLAFQSTEAVITAVEQGAPMRIIGGNLERLPFSFISTPDVNSLVGLRGKIIGVSSLAAGTSSLLRGFLEQQAGLRYGTDYDMRAVGMIPTRWALLQDGKINAGLQGIPMDIVAVEAGFHVIGDIRSYVGELEFASLAVNTDWAAAHRELVHNFMRAMVAAHVWLARNREASADIAVREMGIERRHASLSWDAYVEGKIFPPDGDVSMPGLRAMIELTAQVHGNRSRSGMFPASYVDRSYYLAAKKLSLGLTIMSTESDWAGSGG